MLLCHTSQYAMRNSFHQARTVAFASRRVLGAWGSTKLKMWQTKGEGLLCRKLQANLQTAQFRNLEHFFCAVDGLVLAVSSKCLSSLSRLDRRRSHESKRPELL